MNLTGKHIIITGASSGIGRAACIQASKLGAKVTLIARNESRLKETISLMDGNIHSFYSFDLNNLEEIENLVSLIVEKEGAIDGLVHCAGICFYTPIKFVTPNFVDEMAKIHFFAFVELMRAASLKKRTNNEASYIGVSSIAAFQGNKAQAAYSAVKAAMNGVVHSFAKELAYPRKIRVNTISFGMVETDMYTKFLEVGGNSERLFQEQYLGLIPVDYAGKAICFLLSDLSKYMTGGTLIYDAGRLS